MKKSLSLIVATLCALILCSSIGQSANGAEYNGYKKVIVTKKVIIIKPIHHPKYRHGPVRW